MESLLREITQKLRDGGIEQARLEADILMSSVLKISRESIYSGLVPKISEDQIAILWKFVERRSAHEPIAYIVGHKEFFGRRFAVTQDVLIPRPDTETVIETALGFLRSTSNSRILDVGTGSGCIAATLANEIPGTDLTAWDISEKALEVARRNARELGCSINFQHIDALSPASWNISNPFDMIVSNPPYVRRLEEGKMSAETLKFEPHVALFDPSDMAFYEVFARESHRALKIGGRLVCEINEFMAVETVAKFDLQQWDEVQLHSDLAGKPRVLSARNKRLQVG